MLALTNRFVNGTRENLFLLNSFYYKLLPYNCSAPLTDTANTVIINWILSGANFTICYSNVTTIYRAAADTDRFYGRYALNKPDKNEFLPLFRRIDDLRLHKQRIIVAIDGHSTAGKSSLAALLKSVYSCNVFSMDDFFLRPVQRTQDRLREPGGNIDYERFKEEIIDALNSGEPFSYRPYNCHTMELTAPVPVNPNPLNIIEGAYSLHPYLIGAYDIKVFLSIDETEQKLRLSKRSAELYDRFINEWIPMENKYFSYFNVSDTCDMIFKLGE